MNQNKLEIIMTLIKELTHEERIELYEMFSEEYCSNCWGNCSNKCLDIDFIWD